MHDLSSTTGIVALAAGGVAVVALLLALALAIQLRNVRRAQRVVLGDSGSQDLTEHARGLEGHFRDLHAYVEDVAGQLHARMHTAERRLDGAISYRSLVRYDAYNEMSGRQSTTIALLDASRSGVVLSSIHHRDQARLYAKQVIDGEPELELSPEESEAVRLALSPDSARSTASPE
jgi:hypothetical protein